MATLDLDPSFVRCLKLLHSKSLDSADQLRTALIDAIRLKHGATKSVPSFLTVRENVTFTKGHLKQGRSSPYKKDEFRKESEKRSVEKIEDKYSESFEVIPPKILKLDSPKSKSHSRIITPAVTVSFQDSDTSEQVCDIDNDSNIDDSDDLAALKILEDDLTCVVCKAMDVGAKNRLLECQDCHSLYHQECHKPPISDEDANDPRQVWYCSNCTKSMKKASKSSSKQSGKQSSSSPSQELSTSSKSSSSKSESVSSLFKRSDKGYTGHTQSSSSQAKPVGMAAFAASLKPPPKITVLKSDNSESASKYESSSSKNSSSSVSKSFSSKESSSMSSRSGKTSSSTSVYSKSGTGGSSSSSNSSVSSTAKSSSSSNSSKSSAAAAPNIISADKRLQIMKKKAAKLQEKRKLPK